MVHKPQHRRLTIEQQTSLGPPVSSTNKTDRHDIAEMLLNTIKQTYCNHNTED
jgi:hypothetical protein